MTENTPLEIAETAAVLTMPALPEVPQPSAPAPAQNTTPEYDARARNTFTFEVHGLDETVEIGHVFGPLDDPRYVEYLNGLKIHGTRNDVRGRSEEEACRLWDDLVVDTVNITYPEGTDWRSLIDLQDKIRSLNEFLVVSVFRQPRVSGGALQLGDGSDSDTYVTECYFNGRIVRQEHVMPRAGFELQKKYDRIRRREVRQVEVRGLMKRNDPEMRYEPQDEQMGALYDEMVISTTGFAGGVVPLRFKTAVVNAMFAAKVESKLPGKS